MASTKKLVPLSETRYEKLARDIRKLLEALERSASSEKVRGYWTIGERIAKEKLGEKAGYHNSVLRDLSADSGLAIRTLQETVAFHDAYPAVPKESRLSWSHYRILARLPKGKRNALEKLVLEKSWGARELLKAIDALDEKRPNAVALTRPTVPSYLYRAKLVAVVDGDTLDLDVDLGFHTWTKQRVRLAEIDAPEFGTAEGRAARNFVAETLSEAKSLVVKSLKTDVYGRFVVHVFTSPRDEEIGAVSRDGTHLNELLIRKGFASLFSLEA